MSTREQKDVAGSQPPNHDSPAARGTTAPGKKPYRKPALSKYEQLRGIGIGSV